MKYIGPSMITMILGGLLTGIFGLIASLLKAERTPRWLAWCTFAAGMVVMCAGLWGGIEQNISADMLSAQAGEAATLAAKNLELSEEIRALTQGGNSFCFYHYANYANSPSNLIMRTLVHSGRYPIYDISASTIDVTAFTNYVGTGSNITLASVRSFETRHQLGTLHPNDIAQNAFSTNLHFTDDFEAVPDMAHVDRQEYSITFAARNGMWYEDVIVQRHNGRMLVAYLVRMAKPKKVLFEHVDNGFPLDAGGSIKWNFK